MKYNDEYYDEESDGERDRWEYEESEGSAGSLKGYKVVIALMAVVLVAVSGLYFFQTHQIKRDFAIERDTLTNRLLGVRNDLANLETTNVALGDSIALERYRTDSILDVFSRERNANRATIRKLQNELALRQKVMESFVYTIDSLNQLTTRLANANLGLQRTVATERQRADMAEERAVENENKVRQGARVIARDIGLVLLNSNNREVTRVRNATRLRADLTLSANSLTNPGVRTVYVIITGPDGYVMADPSGATFEFEGDPLIYSGARDDIDYQNDDLEVSVYVRTGGIQAGVHKVDVYMDGLLAGSSEVLLR